MDPLVCVGIDEQFADSDLSEPLAIGWNNADEWAVE